MNQRSSGQRPVTDRRSTSPARQSPSHTPTSTASRHSAQRDPSRGSPRDRRGAATPTASAASPVPPDKVEGVVRVHPRGFGFLEHTGVDGEHAESSFIPPPDLEGFLDGDIVLATLISEYDGRSKVESLSLMQRNREYLYGIAEKHNTTWRLRIDPHVANGAWPLVPAQSWLPEHGDGMLASIDGRSAVALEAYEDPYDPAAVAVCVSVRHRIDLSVPEEEEDVAAEVVEVLARAESRSGAPTDPSRRDLRDVLTLTIDADHSKDLDDALSVSPADDEGVIEVTVHIADVAEYVSEGSAIDRAARKAATSVYLGEWVRPMLPRELSEAALSLIPGAERDTLSVTLAVDQEGYVTASDVFPSRIRSDRRISYLSVAGLLGGDDGHGVTNDDLVDAVFWLHTAASRIGTQRSRRGGIRSSRLESGPGEGDGAEVAHDLIERLMVATNEAVGAWLETHGASGPYRAHPAPAPGAAAEIDRFATGLGFRLGLAGQFTPHSLQAVESTLDASNDPRVDMVWDLLLGHLGRAVYQGTAAEHFGLASPSYLHFTSPLRRYADLEVHRRSKEIIAGNTPAGPDEATAELHDHLNTATRIAARAERDLTKICLMAALARDGKTPNRVFEGRITGFAKPGVRVAFGDDGLSGLVKWRSFDRARYEVDEGGHSLSSPGHPTFDLGQAVRVKIDLLDLERGDIDLVRVRG